MNAFLYNIGKPSIKTISNYEEFKEIYKNDKEQILEIIYYSNKEKIQEILYEYDIIIDIEYFNIKPELPELFYLSSLLDKYNQLNFKYSFAFIQKLDDSMKEKNFIEDKKYIAQIILSKIIIKLIDYFKVLDNYYYPYQNKNEIEEIKNIIKSNDYFKVLDKYYQYKNEIEKIKNRNIEIIKRNLEIFNKEFEFNSNYDINKFLNEKIDDIYKEIISSLFQKAEFNNYDYYKNIFGQIKLESINIKVEILNEFCSTELDIDGNIYLEEYNITKNSNESQKVINFYEILFKFILKDPLFLYNIKFLKDNFEQLLKIYSHILTNSYKKQRINKILEENYTKLISLKKNNLSFKQLSIPQISVSTDESFLAISNNNNLFDDSSNQNDFNDLTQNVPKIENKRIDINIAKELLTNVIIKIKIETDEIFDKEIKKICEYGNNIPTKMDNDFLCKDSNYDHIDDKNINDEEKIIYKKYKQFLDYLDEIEEYIKNSKIHFNPVIILELKKKKLESGDFDMNCVYSFERKSPNNEKITFKDKNILSNGINGKNIGFVLLINELSEIEYKGIEYTDNNKF